MGVPQILLVTFFLDKFCVHINHAPAKKNYCTPYELSPHIEIKGFQNDFFLWLQGEAPKAGHFKCDGWLVATTTEVIDVEASI